MLTCSVTFWSKSEHNVGQSGIGGVYERVREWCSVWDNSPTKSAIHHSTHPSSFLFFLQHISRCLATTRVLTLLTSLFNGAFLAKDPERLIFDRWTILIIKKSSLDMKSLNLCSLLPNLFEITHLMPNNNFIWFPNGEKNCQSVFFFQTCKCPRLLSCTSPRPKRPTCVGFANCCVAKKAFRCLVLTH